MPKRKIVIVLEGGIIQEISGIPKNTVIEVRDFDRDLDPKDPRVQTIAGQKAYVTEWP